MKFHLIETLEFDIRPKKFKPGRHFGEGWALSQTTTGLTQKPVEEELALFFKRIAAASKLPTAQGRKALFTNALTDAEESTKYTDAISRLSNDLLGSPHLLWTLLMEKDTKLLNHIEGKYGVDFIVSFGKMIQHSGDPRQHYVLWAAKAKNRPGWTWGKFDVKGSSVLQNTSILIL
ncbi:MAG: hypothetical protein FGM57_00255 [Candidatus Taylorbacteria bacterium]|nr:hypothetical protein [Candidatus Taylorbacteria bacterium]